MDLEKTLAGILMVKPESVAEISGIVAEEDFKAALPGKIFAMAKACFVSGKPFDLVIASQIWPDHLPYLLDAVEVIPINYVEYAREINLAGRQRRVLTGISAICANPGQSADDMLSAVSDLHSREIRKNSQSYGVADVADRVARYIEDNRKRGKMPGIGTGFGFHDENYVRYVPGHIWVVTGYTSTGKSKLLIEKISRLPPGTKILVISTEMSDIQIMSRFYAWETGYNANLILSGMMSGKQRADVDMARRRVAAREMKIVDDVYQLSDIEAIVQQESMGGGSDVVFIDYVQNCDIAGVKNSEQGAIMAKRLQHLAKQANTCIVCLSQVSNSVGRGDVEQFEAKGAGEWAAVADVGVRLKRHADDKRLLLYDMQKGRHYATGQYNLRFTDDFTRLNEIGEPQGYGT